MACTNCGAIVPAHVRTCISCGWDVGFPNVRSAERSSEREELQRRYEEAWVSAAARSCAPVLKMFEEAVSSSHAVVARDLGGLDSWVKSENALYGTYHMQVKSGIRVPANNKWDLGRQSAEGTIHPNYLEEISYAALSLDGTGPVAYGAYQITLKNTHIAHRATVFEENCINFCQRHRIVAGDPCPAGFRANWSDRGKLAVAKLHHKITSETSPSDFPHILLAQGTTTGEAEFVEAHIYGALHRSVIESVTGPRPRHRADLAIWRSIARQLEQIGIAVVES